MTNPNMKMKEKQPLKLISARDPRVLTAIAPFDDDMLALEGYKDREELSKDMFDCMVKNGGVGLSANQVGLPYNMFVAGGHPQIEKGLKLTCFNPEIISTSKEEVLIKEGCLSFPFLFLNVKRPRKCVLKYEDEFGKLKESHCDGMMSRIVQHEFDHMLGKTFTELVSKLKLDMATKKAIKHIKILSKQRQNQSQT